VTCPGALAQLAAPARALPDGRDRRRRFADPALSRGTTGRSQATRRSRSSTSRRSSTTRTPRSPSRSRRPTCSDRRRHSSGSWSSSCRATCAGTSNIASRPPAGRRHRARPRATRSRPGAVARAPPTRAAGRFRRPATGVAEGLCLRCRRAGHPRARIDAASPGAARAVGGRGRRGSRRCSTPAPPRERVASRAFSSARRGRRSRLGLGRRVTGSLLAQPGREATRDESPTVPSASHSDDGEPGRTKRRSPRCPLSCLRLI
jgi:hypothetical protein